MRLCSRLGLDIPIIQAPTGSVAGPELAAAVSAAGGLGALGITWTSPEATARAIREVRQRTDRPFCVNFALAFPPHALEAALHAGAPIVTFSWGDPAPWIEQVRAASAGVGIQVGSADGARRAVALGADFLLCQGVEAGGHVQSTSSLDRLLAEMRAAVGPDPLLIAAGGLASGADIARVLRLGADGAMLGTRFVATRESRAHETYKRLLLEADEDATALTVCFDGGWTHAPHRVLRNSTLSSWEAAGCPPPGRRPGEGEVIGHSASGEAIARYEDTAPRAGMEGAAEAMALYAGTGVARIADLPSAGELVQRLWAEAQEHLQGE